jgi:hypothetical protein
MAGRSDKLTNLVSGKMASSAGPLIAMNPATIANPGPAGSNPAATQVPRVAPGMGPNFNVAPDPLGRNHVVPARAYPSVGTTKGK